MAKRKRIPKITICVKDNSEKTAEKFLFQDLTTPSGGDHLPIKSTFNDFHSVFYVPILQHKCSNSYLDMFPPPPSPPVKRRKIFFDDQKILFFAPPRDVRTSYRCRYRKVVGGEGGEKDV